MRSNAMVKHIGGPAAGGPLAVMPTAQVLALRQRDPWREATDRARQVATWRETVVSYIRSNFSNEAAAVTEDDVRTLRSTVAPQTMLVP